MIESFSWIDWVFGYLFNCFCVNRCSSHTEISRGSWITHAVFSILAIHRLSKIQLAWVFDKYIALGTFDYPNRGFPAPRSAGYDSLLEAIPWM